VELLDENPWVALWRDAQARSLLIEVCRVNGSAWAIAALDRYLPDVNARSKDGLTPLECALARTRAVPDDAFEKVEMLLERGADPNLATSSGPTFLQRAIADGSLDLVEMLLRFGADPTVPSSDLPPFTTEDVVKRSPHREQIMSLFRRRSSGRLSE
jgi:ankyrin repeat protein